MAPLLSAKPEVAIAQSHCIWKVPHLKGDLLKATAEWAERNDANLLRVNELYLEALKKISRSDADLSRQRSDFDKILGNVLQASRAKLIELSDEQALKFCDNFLAGLGNRDMDLGNAYRQQLTVVLAGVPTAINAPSSASKYMEVGVVGTAKGLLLTAIIVSVLLIRAGLRKVLDRPTDKEIIEKNKLTELHVAAADGDDEAVNRLLSDGRVIDERGGSGETALMLAAKNDRQSTVKLLLKLGADANATTLRGGTASDLAAKQGNADVLAILKAHAKSSAHKLAGGAERPDA